MLNLKLKTIASLINKNDTVIDVACDHAYLAIYLKKNNLCKEVYASDISENAIKNANKNIENANLKIKTFITNGLSSVPPNIDTVVIAGVGANTILDIVKNSLLDIKTYIISSNNNYYLLRSNMAKLGYYNNFEVVIKDNNKYYPIIKFIKSNKKDNKFLLKYGKSNNIDYYNYLLKKEEAIITKLPDNLKIKHQKEINNLKKIIKERT